MPIHVECPHCGKSYDVADELRGKRVRCRGCQEAIPVGGGTKLGKDKSTGKFRDEAPSRKTGTAARRRDEDSDDEQDDGDSRPRKKKKGSSKNKDNTLIFVGAGVVAGVVVLSGLAALFLSSDSPRKKPTPAPEVAQRPVDVVQDVPVAAPVAPAKPPEPVEKPPEKAPEKQPDPLIPDQPAASGQKVYQRLLKSTVLIITIEQVGEQFSFSMGSGSLIDKKNRLILTNHHVVRSAPEVAVFFPTYQAGKLIAEQRYFFQKLEEKKALDLTGKVVLKDERTDLALIQLDKLPPEAQALAFCRKQPRVGDPVYSVGHPGASGGLWVYTHGEVRQFLSQHQWNSLAGGQVHQLQADVVLTNSPTNPGDSGGPLVNSRAEMVAVVQGGARGANLLSLFIDIGEVRKLLDNYEKKAGTKVALEADSGVGGDASTLPTLVSSLTHKDQQIRARAAQALGNLGPDAQMAIPAFYKALKDADEIVGRQAAKSLREVGAPSKEDLPLLIAGLNDDNLRVRGYVVEALGKMGPDARSAVPGLVDVLKKDANLDIRRQAAQALGQMGASAKTQGVPALSEVLKDPEKDLREAAIDALRQIGPDAVAAVPALLAALGDQEKSVRRVVLAALAQIGANPKDALPKLKPAFQDADKEVRRNAFEVLGKLGAEVLKDKETLPMLRKALDDADMRKSAMSAVAKLGPPAKDMAPDLLKHLQDKDHRVQALGALGAILEKAKPSKIELKNFSNTIIRIILLFEDPDRELHDQTVEALGKVGASGVPYLVQALQHDHPLVRYGAVKTLGSMGSEAKTALPYLAVLSEKDPVDAIAEACKKAIARIR